MTARELMEWTAYERVFGPVLIHERVDLGFAQLATIIASSADGKRHKVRDFMPRWYQDLTADAELARGMDMLRGLPRADD